MDTQTEQIFNFDNAILLLKENGFNQIPDLRGFRFRKGFKTSFCSELFFRNENELINYINDYLKSGFLTGFKFNYSNKERAIKQIQTEQDFKSLGIEVYN